MPKLRVYRGRVHLFDRRLDKDEAVIGRSAEADIPLDSPAASRRHLRIKRQRFVWYAEHLGEKNPALLNKRPFTVQKLQHGDTIAIAEHLIVFDYPRDEQLKDREQAQGRAGAGFRLDSSQLEDALHSGSHDRARVAELRQAAVGADSTVAVSPDELDQLMKQMEKRRAAMLVLVAEGTRLEFGLDGVRSMSIGWGDEVQARLPGWRFFGKHGATLVALSTGKHTIAPVNRWVTVLVNDEVVEADRVLADKDVITLQHAYGFGRARLRYEGELRTAVKKAPPAKTQAGPMNSIGPR